MDNWLLNSVGTPKHSGPNPILSWAERQAKSILQSIFANELTYQQKTIKGLAEKNAQILGNHINKVNEGFFLAGRIFPVFFTDQSGPYAYPCLAEPLWKEGEEFLIYLRQVEADREAIFSFLVRLVAPCEAQTEGTLQNMRDALSDDLVSRFPVISEIPRTRPEGYTIRHKMFGEKAYQEGIDRIRKYLVMEILT